jgi:hypothetical protein
MGIMETPTVSPPPASGAPTPTESQPDLLGLAHRLAEKHTATATKPSPTVNKGGRRSAADEAQAWLAKNGLRAVPADEQGQAGPPVGGGYVVDPGFVREMAKTIMKAVEAQRQHRFYVKALAIGADKPLAKELSDGAGAPPGIIEAISISLGECSQKYAWLSQFTPEGVVIGGVLTWIGHDLAMMKRLEKIGKDSKEMTHATAPA